MDNRFLTVVYIHTKSLTCNFGGATLDPYLASAYYNCVSLIVVTALTNISMLYNYHAYSVDHALTRVNIRRHALCLLICLC